MFLQGTLTFHFVSDLLMDVYPWKDINYICFLLGNWTVRESMAGYDTGNCVPSSLDAAPNSSTHSPFFKTPAIRTHICSDLGSWSFDTTNKTKVQSIHMYLNDPLFNYIVPSLYIWLHFCPHRYSRNTRKVFHAFATLLKTQKFHGTLFRQVGLKPTK